MTSQQICSINRIAKLQHIQILGFQQTFTGYIYTDETMTEQKIIIKYTCFTFHRTILCMISDTTSQQSRETTWRWPWRQSGVLIQWLCLPRDASPRSTTALSAYFCSVTYSRLDLSLFRECWLDRDPAHSAHGFGQQVAYLVLRFGLDDWVIDQFNRKGTRTLMSSLQQIRWSTITGWDSIGNIWKSNRQQYKDTLLTNAGQWRSFCKNELTCGLVQFSNLLTTAEV